MEFPGPPLAHPADLSSARIEAPRLAVSTAGDYVGGTRMFTSPTGHAVAFPSHDALVTWYHAAITNPGAAGSYVAAFDKHDPVWPRPIADGIGGEAPLVVTTDPGTGDKHGHIGVPHHHLPHPLPPNVTTVAPPPDTAAAAPPIAASAPDPWASTAADAPPAPAPAPTAPPSSPPNSAPAPHTHGHGPAVPNLPPQTTIDAPKDSKSKMGTYIAIGLPLVVGLALVWFATRDSGVGSHAPPPEPRQKPRPTRGSLPGMSLVRSRR
jgi:hypothetical protein